MCKVIVAAAQFHNRCVLDLRLALGLLPGCLQTGENIVGSARTFSSLSKNVPAVCGRGDCGQLGTVNAQLRHVGYLTRSGPGLRSPSVTTSIHAPPSGLVPSFAAVVYLVGQYWACRQRPVQRYPRFRHVCDYPRGLFLPPVFLLLSPSHS